MSQHVMFGQMQIMPMRANNRLLCHSLLLAMISQFACDAAPISVTLEIDSGTPSTDASRPAMDAHVLLDVQGMPDAAIIDSGLISDAAPVQDAGHRDAQSNPDAAPLQDTGPAEDAAVIDAGPAPDASPGDSGPFLDAEIADTGFLDAQLDAASAPDAEPLDGGFADDAQVIDTGLHADAQAIDTGLHADAQVIDTGLHADAQIPDTGIVPDSGVGSSTRMSFFVTSRRVEINGLTAIGGDLNGLSGADAFCVQLAQEADSTDSRTWRAFLSSTTVDARDRIGTGPWHNALNQLIASDLASLLASPPASASILDEQGRAWNGGPSTRHDVLTGSNRDGRRFSSLADMTSGHLNPNGSLFTFPDNSFTYTNTAFDFSCDSWTTDLGGASSMNYAVVGHLDWSGLAMGTGSDQWITSHVTACDLSEMNLNGGDIRVYCFVEN